MGVVGVRERPGAKRTGDGKNYDPERLFLPPDDDLAPNRPGETLRARLDASGTGRTRLALARLLGRRPVEDEWRTALAGEQLVGTALEELTAGGWEVVHSIVLPGDAIIAHLLIGPGGVFCVGVRHARKRRVLIDDTRVRVARERQPRPHLRDARRDAARSSLVLSRGCGFPVRVRPVLVVVGATSVEMPTAPEDVRVLREREIPELGASAGVLHPDRVARIHTVARNRRVWLWA